MKPGAKYYEHEGRGVPLRLEVGPRDVAQGQVTAAKRTGGKLPLKVAGVVAEVRRSLDEVQRELFERARERLDQTTRRGVTKAELIEQMASPGGFAYGGFCGEAACEDAIKAETKATVRVLPDEEFRSRPAPERCVWCGRAAATEAVWAKAY